MYELAVGRPKIEKRIFMKRHPVLLLSGMTLLAAVVYSGCTRSETSKVGEHLIAHGHYLVYRVAMCIDCHSPRDATGAFISGKDLTGAALGFKPVAPMPWIPAAPGISGLPGGYTEETLAHYLMTGVRPHGLPPTLPPMPPYRMNQRDAKAIAAYLASLSP